MIEQIVETKKKEIEVLKNCEITPRRRPLVSLTLRKGVNIIAELKRKSPSAGVIGEIDDERVAIYSKYAAAISVLTDATYFNGSFEILADVAGKTALPVLCKDFFIDTVQIDLAYAMGADLILLIAKILGGEQLKDLYTYARYRGLNCLVEVHTEEELEKVGFLNADIIGVNARDLDTLVINLERAKEIMSYVSAPVKVAESGIKSRADIQGFSNANAFLIGETLMRSDDLESTFRELING